MMKENMNKNKYAPRQIELTDKELLKELSERIKAGKIKGNSIDYECCYGYTNLYTGRTRGTYAFWKPEFQVHLSDGEIRENKIDDNPDISGQNEHEKATKE